MENLIVNVKCDKQMALFLPILKNIIDNPENFDSADISDESSDSEIYNFNKELDEKNIIFLLNTIGQTYLSTGGFSDNEYIQLSDKFDSNLISSFLEESKEDDYYIEELLDCKFNIEIDFFVEKSLIKISQSKVIINYDSKYSISCKYDKKWINIDDENNQIIIYGKIKNITLYDILYATQSIATIYDKTNFIVEPDEQEYKILDISNDILILKY